MVKRLLLICAVGAALVTLVAAVTTPDDTAATAAGAETHVTTSAVSAPSTRPAPSTTTTSSTPLLPSTSAPASTLIDTTTTPAPTTSVVTQGLNVTAFDEVIRSSTVGRGSMSAGVAVIRDGVVVHAAGFGIENPFEFKAATADTRFRLASVSKMLTAVAVMQLASEQKIDLDRSFTIQMGLGDSFNDPRIGTVTVRQLLSHTSGFAASKAIFFDHGVETWQQAGHAALDQTLQADPGTQFQYSNMNYCLLGLFIEAVTGEPFESVIRERVLQPLDADAHLAPTFDSQPGDALHISAAGRNYMEALGPAGGWVATPVDVAKLAASLRTETLGVHLLDAATVDAMRTPVTVPAPADDWTYGLGLRLFADGSWGHTGTIESTHAIVVNRRDGLTVAVLTSGEVPRNTDDLLGVIDRALAGNYSP